MTPWSQGQRELAGWWQGDLMGPLRQSQAGRREASRQRQARRAGTRARGCSELVWEPVVLQEARKRVGLQVELSDAFQELLETELLNPQGLSGVSGGPGTSLDSSRRFLQRSCSGPFLKDAGTGQEATCAPVGHIRGCLRCSGLAAEGIRVPTPGRLLLNLTLCQAGSLHAGGLQAHCASLIMVPPTFSLLKPLFFGRARLNRTHYFGSTGKVTHSTRSFSCSLPPPLEPSTWTEQAHSPKAALKYLLALPTYSS